MRLSFLLGISLIILVSGCTQTTTNTDGQGTQDGVTRYELGVVSAHDSETDCWIVLEGKVYDVTPFISSHPGGEAILEGCGRDATDLYDTRPMGSGTPHSQNARNLLAQYYIGDIG
jgi:cytochrome b involved in lipid metabolism